MMPAAFSQYVPLHSCLFSKEIYFNLKVYFLTPYRCLLSALCYLIKQRYVLIIIVSVSKTGGVYHYMVLIMGICLVL